MNHFPSNKNRAVLVTSIFSLALIISAVAYGAENITNAEAENLVTANALTQGPGDTYEQDALEVLALIGNSKQLREQLPSFAEESGESVIEHKGALPAAYTLRIAKTLVEANLVRNQLFSQALKHRSALYRIDANFDDTERMTQIIIAMSAAVTLYENNKAMREAFGRNQLLRKKLNEGYPEFGIPPDFYNTSVHHSSNPEYHKGMVDAIRYFADNREAIELEINYSPESIRSLYAHIAQSPILQDFKGGNVFKEIVVLPVKAIGGAVKLSEQGLGHMKFTASKIVGNSIGLIRWRSGKLKDDSVLQDAMQSRLQPGDILLEKTPFTLTDKSIPGHFGHAAIYVGTVEQLSEIDALNLPVVQKNLSKIADGHVVVEALRNGVKLDTLQDFMNVDDVAILRPRNLTVEERREAVALALGNLDKRYDFNFDVNTTEKIVCSELVYIVYPQVDFITKRVLGSFAITPDDIAQKAGSDDSDPLEIILFGHDGKLVFEGGEDKSGLALYDTLVKGIRIDGSPKTQPQQALFDGFIKNTEYQENQ